MKLRMLLLALLCFSPVLAAKDSATEPVQPTFPLTCMPSRDTRMTLNVVGNPPMTAEIIIGFRRSGGAAGAGLRPGECAWRDRRVSDSEPPYICARLPFDFPGAKISTTIAPTPGGPRYFVNVNDRATVFSDLMIEGTPITFQARQVAWTSVPGGRCLEMTPIPPPR
jgi:hypothetical protein